MLPTLPLLHLPCLCRGKEALYQACSPLLGFPQGKEPLAIPQTWLLPPQPTLPSALNRRAVYAEATSLTMLSFPALLPQAKLGARSRE